MLQVFVNSEGGLTPAGYALSVAVLAVCVAAGLALGGYLYWMDYMPDNFPKSLTKVYPIVYNYSYLLAEAAITVILLKIPAVKQALGRIQKNAVKQEEIRQNSQFLP